MKPHDIDVMQHADGERELDLDDAGRAKVAAIVELGEVVRGHLELSGDAVPAARFDAMWKQIDQTLDTPKTGVWVKISRWFDAYRGHLITGMVSAGAVAALALVLRPAQSSAPTPAPVEIMPAAYRPTRRECPCIDTDFTSMVAAKAASASSQKEWTEVTSFRLSAVRSSNDIMS